MLLAITAFLLYLCEEIVAFVIHEDKCREVFNLDFPDSFHAKFRIFHTFYALYVILGKACSRTTDAAKVEAAVLFASIGYSLATVTFCKHYHAATVALE